MVVFVSWFKRKEVKDGNYFRDKKLIQEVENSKAN